MRPLSLDEMQHVRGGSFANSDNPAYSDSDLISLAQQGGAGFGSEWAYSLSERQFTLYASNFPIVMNPTDSLRQSEPQFERLLPYAEKSTGNIVFLFRSQAYDEDGTLSPLLMQLRLG